MNSQLKVLCIHGVGHHEQNPGWLEPWESTVRNEVLGQNPDCDVTCEGLEYDQFFAERPLGADEYAEALWRLGSSWAHHGILDLFRTRRGLQDIPDQIRWTAGMVVQWASDEELRKVLRARLYEHVARFKPDVIFAHSLGSLIAYDAFSERSEGSALLDGCSLVTLGSQIGHPAVRATFGGRVDALANAKCWFHLFNQQDIVFTSSLMVTAPPGKFRQIQTHFDSPGPTNHDMEGYLQHANARTGLWPALVDKDTARSVAMPWVRFAEAVRPPEKRALLVGINEYPRPEMRLGGCVNDVFCMSAALQESGFLPEHIRVVLDERATAQTLRDRLGWLLEDVRDGDQRLFYYSGHGAQIPAYGMRDEVDRVDECLVPVDFDWTRERAITDDELFELYSQLPPDSIFAMILDCCHSGGMARSSGRTARGIDPPDDIRHRMLRWDADLGKWIERKLETLAPDLADPEKARRFFGESGAKARLGRSASLRTLGTATYDAVREAKGHSGPYLPIVLEACQEGSYAYEYRHGVTSYGAFTFALTERLRRIRNREKRSPSFTDLVAGVNDELRRLAYEQEACVLGPKVRVEAPVPWESPAG